MRPGAVDERGAGRRRTRVISKVSKMRVCRSSDSQPLSKAAASPGRCRTLPSWTTGRRAARTPREGANHFDAYPFGPRSGVNPARGAQGSCATSATTDSDSARQQREHGRLRAGKPAKLARVGGCTGALTWWRGDQPRAVKRPGTASGAPARNAIFGGRGLGRPPGETRVQRALAIVGTGKTADSGDGGAQKAGEQSRFRGSSCPPCECRVSVQRGRARLAPPV